MEEGEVGIGMGLLGGVMGGMIVVTKSVAPFFFLSALATQAPNYVICEHHLNSLTYEISLRIVQCHKIKKSYKRPCPSDCDLTNLPPFADHGQHTTYTIYV